MLNWDTSSKATRRCVLLGAVGASFALAVGLVAPRNAQATEDLNMLAWCDHADAKTFEPFEEKYDVKINMKDYEGTGAAIAILEQSEAGDWDLMSVDTEGVNRLASGGWLEPLNPADYPIEDFYPEVVSEASNSFDGKVYGISEKFGYNAIAYNRDKYETDEMREPAALWDPKYKGKVAVYDYYFTIIQTIAVALGISPDDLAIEDLPAIREKLLQMKDNAVLIGDVVQTQTALASGEVDIVIGGAEFTTAALAKEMPHLDWVLPNAGGLRWQSSMSVLKDSNKKDLAMKYIQWNSSPEAQALLATAECYWGMPANRKAVLGDHAKKVLRWDEQENFLAKSHAYTTPDEALDKAMLDMWTEVLQN